MARVEFTVSSLRDDLLQLGTRAVALCDSIGPDELARRVEPQRWSVVENLEHLRITADTFLPAVDIAVRRTHARGARCAGPFRLSGYGRALVRYVEPPPLIRLPAPKVLRPLAHGPPDGMLDRFLEGQRRISAQLDASDGLDLVALRFGSPLASCVRMNLLEFFAVFNGHTRRHLWQAESVRQGLGGPSRSEERSR
jgi:hypothetical protein